MKSKQEIKIDYYGTENNPTYFIWAIPSRTTLIIDGATKEKLEKFIEEYL